MSVVMEMTDLTRFFWLSDTKNPESSPVSAVQDTYGDNCKVVKLDCHVKASPQLQAQNKEKAGRWKADWRTWPSLE